jgi:anti-anti-sigma factor
MSLGRDLIYRQFIDRGITHVVIDCERCLMLPSIAFGTLTSLARDFRRIQGTMQLVHVSTKIRTLLTRTRLDESLPVMGTLTEAIRKTTKPVVP